MDLKSKKLTILRKRLSSERSYGINELIKITGIPKTSAYRLMKLYGVEYILQDHHDHHDPHDPNDPNKGKNFKDNKDNKTSFQQYKYGFQSLCEMVYITDLLTIGISFHEASLRAFEIDFKNLNNNVQIRHRELTPRSEHN